MQNGDVSALLAGFLRASEKTLIGRYKPDAAGSKRFALYVDGYPWKIQLFQLA